MSKKRPSKDYAYEALLRFNYFPMVKNRRDELPPVFSTRAFKPDLADELITKMQSQKRKEGFDQIVYRSNRFNNVIRTMHIPHPLPYARMCQTLRDNWKQIKFLCKNKSSKIKPERHNDGKLVAMGEYDLGRLIVMDSAGFPDSLEKFLRLSTGAFFVTSADISNCFPSIYTHSIPWALVGHADAKKDHDPKKWFNAIDAKQRHLKRNETQGIPIGPATSNVVCEIILAQVDKRLRKLGYRFVRAIDDYQCYTATRDEGVCFIRDLELELDRYLLKLNTKKTACHQLPLPERAEWINEFCALAGDSRRLTGNKMFRLLDLAVDFQSRWPADNVLKYAATYLMNRVNAYNAYPFVEYLLQLAFHNASVLPLIAEVLDDYKIELDNEVLERLLDFHLKYRRSDVACWLLLIMHLNGGKASKAAATEIIKQGDCLPMALMATAKNHRKKIDKFLLNVDETQNYEMDQYWLLIYNRARQNPRVKARFKKYLDETGLTFLESEGVRFTRTKPFIYLGAT
jgi:hypothetical protein